MEIPQLPSPYPLGPSVMPPRELCNFSAGLGAGPEGKGSGAGKQLSSDMIRILFGPAQCFQSGSTPGENDRELSRLILVASTDVVQKYITTYSVFAYHFLVTAADPRAKVPLWQWEDTTCVATASTRLQSHSCLCHKHPIRKHHQCRLI